MSDRTRTAIVSFVVIAGYLAFGYLLLTGWIKPNVTGDVALVLTGVVAGVLTAGFCWSLGYELGSSAGSRAKDALIAGQLPPPPLLPGGPPVSVPPVAPLPLPPVPKPLPGLPMQGATVNRGVTATVFSDQEADNAEVAYSDVKPGWGSRPGVALPYHFKGDRPAVQVTGPKGSVVCQIVDVGPWYDGRPKWPADPYWQTGSRPRAETDPRTNGAGIDLTPAAASAVGVAGKGKVDWAFVGGAIPPPVASGGEPAWLTLARGEIGFHETGDNQGIGKYAAGAGFGAEGDPWCSIFAGWAVKTSGVDIAGVNAMARSWTTAPSMAKLDAPRLGCIVVFWRGSKAGSEGHVGFWISEDATYIQTLGGNENDQVEIEPIPKAGSSMGLLGYFWPAGIEPKVT